MTSSSTSTSSSSKLPLIRTAYDGYDTSIHALKFDDPSLTQQNFADECDINNILKRMESSGAIDHFNDRQPQYIDASVAVDYHTACLTVMAAQSAFDNLPARVRERFHNDPMELMEFVSDDKNRAEAAALGLLNLPSEPSVVQATNTVTEEGSSDREIAPAPSKRVKSES